MTIKSIEIKQKKMAKALQTLVHPDNPLAQSITARYRELEESKQKLR